MMRQLRDKRLMHGVLWSLVFVFVFFIFFSWGMKFTGSGQRDPNTLAKIGGETVTYEVFNKTYEPAVEKLYKMKEDNPTSDEIKKLKEDVLNNLVDDAILRQTAVGLGLSVPDDELAGTLQHQRYFLDDSGKFDKKKYYQVLEANQLTPEEFESSQKEEMLLQKIRTVFQDGIIHTPQDVERFAGFLNRDLKADYVVMNLASYEKNITPSTPDLEAYYQTNKSRYDHAERIKIRHILISLQGSESLQDEAKAKASLEDYRRQILSKKSTFQEMAKKVSQDNSTKDQGGELGWLTRNSMGDELKDFETAIFKLKKGELSEPIKSKFGYHLVFVEDHENAYKSTFAEVKSKVLEQYKKEKGAQKILSLSEALAEKLNNKDSLKKAAADLGLPLLETAWFNRATGIPGLKDSKDISDELADLYSSDWKGPLESGEKEMFFQITEARESGKDPQALVKDTPGIGQRLTAYQQDLWLKDFLADQKKKLKVKTFLNS